MGAAFFLSTEDAVAWLGGMSADSAPLVILDPGVPGRAPRRPSRRGEPTIPAFPEARLPALLYEVHRVLRRDGLCWWLSETAHAFRCAQLATRLGFAIGAPLVWDRGDGPGARLAFALPLSPHRPRSPGAELVVAPRRDDPPGRLPDALCAALIESASVPGDVIVDPFMGSGAIGLAALVAERAYLGNDLVAPPASWVGRLAASGDHDPALVADRAAPGSAGELRAGAGGAGQLTIFGDGAELR